MRAVWVGVGVGVLALCQGVCAGRVEAAEATEISATVVPARYSWVDGDAGKFRAHHWRSDRYTGGLKDLHISSQLPGEIDFEAEGHALGENEFGADVRLNKPSLGFLTFDFQEFRKYFDGTGGVHRRFAINPIAETDKELALDIGKLELETGLTLENWPVLEFAYEREYKDGAKSRLTWGSSIEGGESRKIVPSWQDVEEIVDAFAVRAHDELGGFHVNGEQRWEFSRSENFRWEQQMSTTSTAADRKIRTQDQAPQADIMTTTFGAERHFWQEKAFFASGYHYAHVRNREFETLTELSQGGVVTNFTRPEQKPNNRADNDLDSHSWVSNFTVSPAADWQVSTRLKSEVMRRHGNSVYNMDGLPGGGAQTGEPDGIINRFDLNLTDNKAVRWGESVGLRFTGIPRTALYTDVELEQGRVLMREDRISTDGPDAGNGVESSETFRRETVTNIRRGAWTLGGQVTPAPAVSLTSHIRRRRNNNDYDDQRETLGAGKSAFMDEQNAHTDEFTAKLTWRPARWLRSSVRYQYRDDDYFTRAESEPVVETEQNSHIQTYDVAWTPTAQFSALGSFSRQDLTITTPAEHLRTANRIPAFNADVNTWLLGLNYAPAPQVMLTQSLLYARARNFDDYSNYGIPYGMDFDRVDVSTGVTYTVDETTSIGAEYGYYTYDPNVRVEPFGYDVHEVWFEVSKHF